MALIDPPERRAVRTRAIYFGALVGVIVAAGLADYWEWSAWGIVGGIGSGTALGTMAGCLYGAIGLTNFEARTGMQKNRYHSK